MPRAAMLASKAAENARVSSCAFSASLGHAGAPVCKLTVTASGPASSAGSARWRDLKRRCVDEKGRGLWQLRSGRHTSSIATCNRAS
eukprot:3687090-Rhodomonas_salina.4